MYITKKCDVYSGLIFSKYLQERKKNVYAYLSIAKTLHRHITGRHLIIYFIFMSEPRCPKEKDKYK